MRALLQERQWQREHGLGNAQTQGQQQGLGNAQPQGQGPELAPGQGLDQAEAQGQGLEQTGQGLGLEPGKNTLYFGCQKSAVDYIYRDEIEAMTDSKVIVTMSCDS